MRAKPFISRPAMLRAVNTVGIGKKAANKWCDALANYPEALQEILSRYRILRWRQDCCPSRDSVRETLKRLSHMQPKDAARRWPRLDEAVKVEIRRAARSIACPDNLPEAANAALKSMIRKQPGRARNAEAAVLFAAALARYWHETEQAMPTAHGWTDCRASPFHAWAKPLFEQAGYRTGDIQKHLQAGVKKYRG